MADSKRFVVCHCNALSVPHKHTDTGIEPTTETTPEKSGVDKNANRRIVVAS